MSGNPFRQLLPPLLAALMLTTLLPGVAAAATRPTRFDLYLGSSCISGFSSDNATVDVTWRRASGALVLAESYRAGGGGGYWEACAGDGFTTPLLRLGDRLEAKVGTNVRRFTVPTLTLRFARAKNFFHGQAPAGTPAWVAFPRGLYADYEVERRLTVNGNGTWRHRENNFDIVGGQYAYLRWRSAKNDQLTLDGTAPYFRVTLGDSGFSGIRYAGKSVRARLVDPSSGAVIGAGNATAGRHGAFSGQFRDAGGAPVAVAAGQRVEVPKLAMDASWIVPNVTGSVDTASDVVKGRCLDAGSSARWYDVRVFAPDGETRAREAGNTGSRGRFEIDFGDESGGPFYSSGDVIAGDTVVISCLQHGGDWVERRFTAP